MWRRGVRHNMTPGLLFSYLLLVDYLTDFPYLIMVDPILYQTDLKYIDI